MEPRSPLDYPFVSPPNSPDIYKEQLAGTVDAYDQHVFIVYGNHRSWPRDVENEPYPKRLFEAWAARQNNAKLKTKIMICDIPKGFDDVIWDGDVLLFPDLRTYKFLDERKMNRLVDNVLVKGDLKADQMGAWLSHEDAYIFVCAHRSRDRRCAYGSLLIDMFHMEIERRGWQQHVLVFGCSDSSLHHDAHKFAPHLIIFSHIDGFINGHWYGCVTHNDVDALLDQHIAQGEIVQQLWRGQMNPKKLRWLRILEQLDEEKKARAHKRKERRKAREKQRSKISWNYWHIGILGALVVVATACRFYRRSR